MELIKKLPPETKVTSTGTTKQNSMGLFLCPICSSEVVKVRGAGRAALSCGIVGCRQSGPRTGHMQSGTPVYVAWAAMRNYCHRSTNQICPEWDSFSVFSEDMLASYRPGTRLARLVSVEPYSKANCLWISADELLDTPTNSVQQSAVTGRLFEQHGMHSTRQYKIWQNMRTRCYDPNSKRYEVYGGKGIKVCYEWLNSFTNFWQDMKDGYTDEMTIDRKDSDKDYYKDNCRWLTLAENSSRSRATVTQQIDMQTGVVIKEWPSARTAGLTLGIDPSSITKVCLGKKQSAGGFRWSN